MCPIAMIMAPYDCAKGEASATFDSNRHHRNRCHVARRRIRKLQRETLS